MTVIGAGVIGLSTAIRAAEAGHEVTIAARDFTPNTTSDRAGAIWFPFMVKPAHKVPGWGSAAARQFLAFRDARAAGVTETDFTMFFDVEPEIEGWEAVAPNFEAGPMSGGGAYSWKQKMRVPFADVSLYMPFLHARALACGVAMEECSLLDLIAAPSSDVIINCSGLGASGLCDDQTMFPVRGQVIAIPQRGWTDAIADERPSALAYIFPRTNDIVLGGTAQVGDTGVEPRASDTEAIIERCRALDPRLGEISDVRVSVGLRPGRPSVRLERERVAGRDVVHNYGHGGAGFTVSWGCADEAVALANQATGWEPRLTG
ncbi:MAG: FAD-dependent oxidoreductase [Candidatus Dormibacteria bacterium]